jgi:ankyrin repeat protein
MIACISNSIGIVEYLLRQEDVDINAQDKHGKTALMHAALYGYEPIIDMLLKRTDLNKKQK